MGTTVPASYASKSTEELHLLLDALEDDLDAGSTDANVEADIDLVKAELFTREENYNESIY